MIEVELKVRVPALAPVREKLAAAGAVCSERTREHDVYYNAPHRDFGTTDEALRVRYSNGGCAVTYKGPKRRDSPVKTREELTEPLGSGASFEGILRRLGFVPVACVDKVREYYLFRETSVALDEVAGLGTFVEIEAVTDGTADHIAAVARELGVDGTPIQTSYLEMLLAKGT